MSVALPFDTRDCIYQCKLINQGLRVTSLTLGKDRLYQEYDQILFTSATKTKAKTKNKKNEALQKHSHNQKKYIHVCICEYIIRVYACECTNNHTYNI